MNTKAETQKLILNHMGLAYKIAWKYRGCRVEQEELQAAALLGLVKAAAEFDAYRKVKFSAFAAVVIRNEIHQELRKVRKYQNCLSLDSDYRTVCESPRPVPLTDRIACEETGFEKAERKDLFPSLLSMPELTGKEQKTILLVIGRGMTQKEAGDRMGLSQPSVSRSLQSGIRKLRKRYQESR